MLEQRIDKFIEDNKDAIVEDIRQLVAIDSVQSAPEADAPFGPGARDALLKTLEIADRLGLATHNLDNYIGWAEVPGTDADKHLAAICHVDVVPAGNGWDADPFTLRVKDNWLLGRGVADDKGPMVLVLYALKFLREQGGSLRYGLRALVGTNEETGMRDVPYYMERQPAPAFCFTPEAEFPVCNGEKGHFNGKIVSPVCNGNVVEMEGGVANNAVPDRASALVKADISKLADAEGVTVEAEGEYVRVRGWGKSGHACRYGERHRSGGGLHSEEQPGQRGRDRLLHLSAEAASLHCW